MQRRDEGANSTAELHSRDESGGNSLSLEAFLNRLTGLGVELRVKDGKLLLNAPVGALTAELQQELRRRKPELLARLEAANDEEERVAPLTYAQQRLWLIDRFTPNGLAYNIPQSWIVETVVDLEVLRQSIQRLAERHQGLRTRIEMRREEVVQVVMRHVEVPLQFTDLSDCVDSETLDSKLQRILVGEGRKPFELQRAPLIRFHIVKLAEDRYVIFYNIHHIVADQWSLNTLKRDLIALYSEHISGQIAKLPILSTQYADVAIRERGEAAIKMHAQQLNYWRERLKGMPAILELPFSNGGVREQKSDGDTLRFSFEADTTRKLREYAARRNKSLYLLMLSAFAALLYRYTVQKDICIGTPVTERKRREEEDLVGLFVNMLPLRIDVEPSESFDALLERVGSAVLADFEQSDIPFQKLVTELSSGHSQSSSPFFQVTFALNAKSSEAAQEETFIGTSKFDLSLQISEQAKTLDAYFEFRTDIFTRADIKRLSAHFVRLTQSLIGNPQKEVGLLEMLTEQDRLTLRAWNATGLPFDRDDTLISLFERQVEKAPQAIALQWRGRSYTFAQLHTRVAGLGYRLSEAGVGVGSYVAICLERTPQLIVSILAVLKAGAAYLPLDPKYPEERLAFMLEDSGARTMIALRGQVAGELARNHPAVRVMFVADEDDDPLPGEEIVWHAPCDVSGPGDAAYLIYTSGSTGRPKGVVVEHRNAVALLAWARGYFDQDSIRGILASTSVCFDLSIFEIFLPLSTGNTIVLVDDVLEFPKCSDASDVTMVNTVPSAMNALLQAGFPPPVDTVCLAGEFLPQELVERIYETGVKRVFDLYGPTETTTYSTCALRLPGFPPTIGRPISNTRIYLLDESLSQVPPGAVGEIVIGGEGVTRGYLHRPELTDERFLQLAEIEPNGRLYRTGDLSRQREDGSLVYLGRRDQQAKLRGHRIELGEIESVLREESGALQVAVVVQQMEAGPALVAFVASSREHTIDEDQCQSALRRRLPAHMIPARIVCLDELPLTPNGKIDRNALSARIVTRQHHRGEAPRDLLEQWLANLWALRLGKREIAREAHFFEDLGGHSLVAFEIFADIEKRLGVAMMLATLFQAPTVELLARAISLKPWVKPRHLRLIAPGTGERVIYVVGNSSGAIPGEIGNSGERVMAVGVEDGPDELEGWTREMAAFEADRPALLLVAETSRMGAADKLASSLANVGFNDISVLGL